uniref:Neurobeachinlike protein putative n=1 Tax=Albugo laibachii Nc14 TaxID=890382 RepID=F0WHU1_9STRA|nr:neurobeachinlike protein putative [Albugo laibachii Nc14]|eukprot:CCA20816.1 neurobeachinlike protein putative [Albugo laibachii Nc14]
MHDSPNHNMAIDKSSLSLHPPPSPSHVLYSLLDQLLLLAYEQVMEPPLSHDNLLNDIQHTLAHIKQLMLCEPHQSCNNSIPSQSIPTLWPHISINPPRNFFGFSPNSNITFPSIDWSSFRGYSIAIWLYIDISWTSTSTKCPKLSTFTAFHVSNRSNSLGVETLLYWDTNDTKQRVFVSVRSRANASFLSENQRPKSNFEAQTPNSGQNQPESALLNGWEAVDRCINIRNKRWHLLVISHSSHYLKKSSVACILDGETQFQADLSYPSALITASNCYCGAGSSSSLRMSGITMYPEELQLEQIAMIYRQGPNRSLIHAARGRYRDIGRDLVSEFQEEIPNSCDLSMLSSQDRRTLAELANRRVLFSFAAIDTIDNDRVQECIREGHVTDSQSKWITMETLGPNSASAEMQHRHAQVHGDVRNVHVGDIYSAWHHVVGIEALPVLFHYILTGFEHTLNAKEMAECMESIFIDLLWILAALLSDTIENQEAFLQAFGCHALYHTFLQHKASFCRVWMTEGCLSSMFEFVQGIGRLCVQESPQKSVWSSNPLFGTALRVLFLNSELWEDSIGFKTQAYFYYHLSAVVCQSPRIVNELEGISRLLLALERFSEIGEASECVQAITQMMETCLLTQTHAMDPAEKEELAFIPVSVPEDKIDTLHSSSSLFPSWPGKKSGYLQLQLEGIEWSDQKDMYDRNSDPLRPIFTHLSSVLLRTSLLRDIRRILAFLLLCRSSNVTLSLLRMLQRLSDAHIDVRVALLGSNLVDSLLFVQHRNFTSTSIDLQVQLCALRLLLSFLSWLESVQGRTVWCALEERLQSLITRQSLTHQATSVLERMQAHWLQMYSDSNGFGIKQSVLFNEFRTHIRTSMLFPVPSLGKQYPSQEAEAKDKPLHRNRVILTWDQRLALGFFGAYHLLPAGSQAMETATLAFDLAEILQEVPLPSVLPYLPLFLAHLAAHEREEILLRLSVSLKTSESLQKQLISMPGFWPTAFLRLCTTSISCGDTMQTGEDLVQDFIVTLLAASMHESWGWEAFRNVILAVQAIQEGEEDRWRHVQIVLAPLDWLARVTAIVLQRMARHRVIFSRTLADNVYHVLFMVESLLLTGDDSGSWSGSQHLLFQSIVDLSLRLMESTQKAHRIGLRPALQILLRALSFVDVIATLLTIIDLIGDALQHEVYLISAVRVFDDLSPREISLNTLAGLQEAIHAHEKAYNLECIDLLYQFVNRVANSGCFIEELHGILADITEEEHARVILQRLQTELPRCTWNASTDERARAAFTGIWGPSRSRHVFEKHQSFASACFGGEYSKVAQAAWSMEFSCVQNWAEHVRSLANRKGTASPRQRFGWTHAMWLKQEYLLRSQHAQALSADSMEFLAKKLQYRLCMRESPMPTRARMMLEVTIDSLDAIQACILTSSELKAEASKHSDTLSSHLMDHRAACRGDFQRRTKSKSLDSDTRIVSREKGFRMQSEDSVYLEPGESHLPRHQHILVRTTCYRVVPEGLIPGTLLLSSKRFYFVPNESLRERAQVSRMTQDDSSFQRLKTEFANGLRRVWRWKYRNVAGVFVRRYRLEDSALEIFMSNGSNHFLDFSLESSPLNDANAKRDQILRLLCSFMSKIATKQVPERSWSCLSSASKAWRNFHLSNFDYLMILNTCSGRSFNDLTQYPVFPWILSDYDSVDLDLDLDADKLEANGVFRDLSKPMGALNADRLREYWERYNSFEDPLIPKFLYGSHYSTYAGVVLFYLFRLEPFAHLHRQVQGGSFDLPDRLFTSVKETWAMCNSQMSEVKELTPEFFTSPAFFLRNLNEFALGIRHDRVRIGDVKLPKWADGSPEAFIRHHRRALESNHVSAQLSHWIDLIFGFQQRGQAALDAQNLFYHLTYHGVVEMEKLTDPHLRDAVELQIAHFGQCPKQVFMEPHGMRQSVQNRRKTPPDASFAPVQLQASVSCSSDSKAREWMNEKPSSLRRHSIANDLMSTQNGNEDPSSLSKTVVLQRIDSCALRHINVLPEYIVAINEVGAVELLRWRVVPHSNRKNDEMLTHSSEKNAKSEPRTLDAQDLTLEHDKLEREWILHVDRAREDVETLSRVPVSRPILHRLETFEIKQAAPIITSLNGRLIVSGGDPNGGLLFRLLDPDTGLLVAKASMYGHDDSVTCLAMDVFQPHSACSTMHAITPTHQLEFDQELLVSGSCDGILAFWVISKMKQDLLFHPPRISTTPVMYFRGHRGAVVDCDISTSAGFVVSCTFHDGIVQYLHENGQVAFHFKPATPTIEDDEEQEECGGMSSRQLTSLLAIVRASSKGFVCVVTKQVSITSGHEASLKLNQLDVICSICEVYDVSGRLHHFREFQNCDILSLKLSGDGNHVVISLSSGRILSFHIEEYVTSHSLLKLIPILCSFSVAYEYSCPMELQGLICTTALGPREASLLLAVGLDDGTLVMHLLPEADGSVSFLSSMGRLFGVNAKLKMVKETVHQAQSLALTTLGNAKAVTSTARDIAGEAFGEAKTMVRGLLKKWNPHGMSTQESDF